MKNDLYLHLKQQAREAVTPAECDHIITAAFHEYIKDNLTDTEYGRIYFACIERINGMS